MWRASDDESTIRFHRFELDLRTRELRKRGVRLNLQGHPVDLLAALLETPGKLVTRDELRKKLWPDHARVSPS